MVKTDSYVQFEAGKLTYRVVPVTEAVSYTHLTLPTNSRV